MLHVYEDDSELIVEGVSDLQDIIPYQDMAIQEIVASGGSYNSTANDSISVTSSVAMLSMYEEDCDSVRTKIQNFLTAKTMTQIEFLRVIGCSSDSLSRFMKLKGKWNGTHNRVFWNAQKYLASQPVAQESSSSPPEASRKRRYQEPPLDAFLVKKSRQQIKLEKRALKNYNEELFATVAGVTLEVIGGKVPVFDDCDDVRVKSLELMDHCGLRTKDWLRLIGNVNTKSWNDFIGYKGPSAGASNRAYYNSYVFLEKLRIARSQDKSQARLASELEYGVGGRPLKHDCVGQVLSVSHKGILAYVEGISLEGEAQHKVPVYDDCEEVRRKSQEFIQAYGIKVSEWLRLLGNVNCKSWKDFLSYEGERAGAANRSYYAAYVFLEKVRIASGHDKSSSRVLSELEFGEAGRPLKHVCEQEGSLYRNGDGFEDLVH